MLPVPMKRIDSIKPAEPATCLLLVGGASRRMKKNKAFLPLGQETIIGNTLKILKPVFQSIILCSSDPAPYEHLNIPLAKDRFKGEGPMVAIEAGLNMSETDLNFVMACDIPEINTDILEKLFDNAPEADIVVPQQADLKYEPLFALYRKRINPLITELLDKGERQILQVYPLCKTINVPIPEGTSLWNLNTPEDYKKYLSTQKHK